VGVLHPEELAPTKISTLVIKYFLVPENKLILISAYKFLFILKIANQRLRSYLDQSIGTCHNLDSSVILNDS